MLDVERQYYADHLEEWLERYRGRVVLVKDQQLVGDFDTEAAALGEAARRYGLAPVLVRRVEPTQPEFSIPALTLGLLNAVSSRAVRGLRTEPARPADPTRP